MATQDDYIKTALRLPRELHAKLQEAADSTGRSMNAEIIQRLEWALKLKGDPEVTKVPATSQPVGGDLTWHITSEIRALAEHQGVPFDEMLAKIFLAGIHHDAPQVFYVPVFPGATREDMKAAIIASEEIGHPDAAFVTEMLQRAPWAPSWMLDRLASQGRAAPGDAQDDEDDPAATKTISAAPVPPGLREPPSQAGQLAPPKKRVIRKITK